MRTHLVTGANSGVGFETVRALAAKGERVIMVVRDPQRGEAAREVVRREVPAAQLELERVDLLDLDSVRALAERVGSLDVLVNNAGLGAAPFQLTKERVYSQFGANHLGHFLLTALLWPKLEQGNDPRVVTVSSGFGKKGTLDLDNLDGARGYGQGRAYMQSKLANALFGAELDRRLRARGSKVQSVVVHPGVAATEMQKKADGFMGLVGRLVHALASTPQRGARPTVDAATLPEVRGGEVYGPGRGDGPAKREATWPSMLDREGAAALWKRSEELCAVRFLS
jgi:NAD(P)-dependent dehydrogenase (short-subunit alcohol dehydrogenase family)